MKTPEPVAWLVQHSEMGDKHLCDTEAMADAFVRANPRWMKCSPLYTLPKGSIVLSKDEAEQVRHALELGQTRYLGFEHSEGKQRIEAAIKLLEVK